MMLLWCCHGVAMVLLWCWYGVAMVLPWCCYGVAMVLLWCWYGVAMVLPWCCYGVGMVLLWCCYGVAMVLVWCLYKVVTKYSFQSQSLLMLVSEIHNYILYSANTTLQRLVRSLHCYNGDGRSKRYQEVRLLMDLHTTLFAVHRSLSQK